MSTSGLPPADNSLLVVSLAELSEAGTAILLQHFHQALPNTSIQHWHPTLAERQSVAAQGPYPDSQENLYGVAILARRSGWTGFVVADGLANRQAHGSACGGENAQVSVVMVAVRPAEQDHSTGSRRSNQDRVRVFAQRTTGAAEENSGLLDALRSFTVSHTSVGDRLARYGDLHMQHGLELHDPDRGVFVPGTVKSLGCEELGGVVGAEGMCT
ncbi:hypothetical protein NUU61_004778 [Penicillium alfredii]|uniref:Uncharacterized protein n=1 Tax=Penicillium alfredii TaxID=1506179 RepID=A0A9W9F8G9_9EURO|nr:uncharacterized protein NUU61_004778 [Penicillium alfredii]KAJ5095422.1 hypothetical protein NUU61_004778 [Penicillium alfredii]